MRKKSFFAFLLSLALIMCMFTELAPDYGTAAAESLKKPAYKLKRVNGGSEIRITINPTTGAAGYYIYMKAQGQKKYKKITTLKEDGTEVRRFTVRNLKEGVYRFKIKAYSTASLTKTSKVKKIGVGRKYYAMDKEKYRLNDNAVPGLYDSNGYRFFSFGDYDINEYSYVENNIRWTRFSGSLDSWLDSFKLWQNEDFYDHLNLLYNLRIDTEKESFREIEDKIADWLIGLSGCTCIVPDSIVAFDGKTFNGASWLKEVRLSGNFAYIDSKCFDDCVNLETISIPDSVSYISEESFRNCPKLNSSDYSKIEKIKKY